MPPDALTPPARRDALAELAAEAARFAEPPPETTTDPAQRTAPAQAPRTAPPAPSRAPRRSRATTSVRPAAAGEPLPGYMPNAVAPERGNTRPAVPVDGRLHLRAAPAAVDGLDEVITTWRARDPRGLRDLERATLIRIGIGIVLADVAAHGENGMVGEAVRAALDPAQRHLAVAMPDPRRWLREAPQDVPGGEDPASG